MNVLDVVTNMQSFFEVIKNDDGLLAVVRVLGHA
jgi:hypothetical protein